MIIVKDEGSEILNFDHFTLITFHQGNEERCFLKINFLNENQIVWSFDSKKEAEECVTKILDGYTHNLKTCWV